MKTKFRFAAVLLCALAGSLAHQAAHAYALFFETSANPVNVGDTFTVKVQLDDPAYLVAADFVMDFSKLLVQVTGASSPSFGAGLTSTIVNGDGTATFSMFSFPGFDATATGPITLVEVAFEAIAEGSALISVRSPADLGFDVGAPADVAQADASDARVEVRIRSGTVNVPEPESLALLGVAIAAAGLGVARRRAIA